MQHPIDTANNLLAETKARHTQGGTLPTVKERHEAIGAMRLAAASDSCLFLCHDPEQGVMWLQIEEWAETDGPQRWIASSQQAADRLVAWLIEPQTEQEHRDAENEHLDMAYQAEKSLSPKDTIQWHLDQAEKHRKAAEALQAVL